MFSKKNMLSLVASVLLCGNVYAGSNTQYVPLSTSGADNGWVLFGVNGFTDGISASGGSGDSFNTNGTQLTDTTAADGIATSGLPSTAGDATTDMAKLQALDLADNTAELSAITVNVDISDVTFSATEPTRVMYIDANSVSGVDLKFEYKASLEGKTLEMQIDGDTSKVYTVTISYLNTYNNPAVAVPASVAVPTSEISTITDIIDYDITNNPLESAEYHDTTHRDDVAAANARFYSYDSTRNSWKLWDRDNSAIANDFTEFEKGKAYWGKVDVDGDGSSANTENAAGLILGSSGQSTPDETVYAGNLNEGWNMLSFDSIKPSIITATTGLIVTTKTAGGDITITDSTGLHSIDITIAGAATMTGSNADAKAINLAVQSAKGLGTLPEDMNLKAFAVAANSIAILSDKKFTIKDKAATDNVGAVTTIAGQNPWDEANSVIGAVTDLDANGASSVYGEYMMLIEPLVDDATTVKASDLDTDIGGTGNAGSAAIQINGGDKIYLSADLTTPALATLATVESSIEADEAFDGTDSSGAVSQVDIDFDDTTDLLLLAATDKFYIKDHTFTRVHEFDGTDGDAALSFTVSGTTDDGNTRSVTVTPDATATITEAVTAINAAADTYTAVDDAVDTEIYAYEDGTKIVTVSTSAIKLNLQDSATATNGFLTDSVSGSADIYKGAVKNVYAVNEIIKNDIVANKWEMSSTNLIDDELSINMYVNGNDSDDLNASFVGPHSETESAEKLVTFDFIVEYFNQYFADNNITAAAKHDYTISSNPDCKDVTITVEGYGVASVSFKNDDINNTGVDANAATAGMLSSYGTPLTSDLKYNAIYTPNYVVDGPLYTLKDAGFEPKAIIGATTDIASSNDIEWSNIDITKTQSQWFENNEYNLFNINDKAGYWVYLDTYTTAPTIAFSNITYNPKFKHSFNADGVTVNNIDEGTFSAEISGISASDSKVIANVGGYDLELIGAGSSLTTTITKYEAMGITANTGSPINISLTASNGLGDSYSEASVATIDYDQPDEPTVTFSGAEATFASTSTDVTSYYLYKDNIPETSTESSANKVDYLTAAEAAAYNICTKTAFNNSANGNAAVSYKLFAMDGDGILGSANASNVKSFEYLNFLNSASVLSHTYGSDSALLAEDYDSSCVSTGTATTNNGVEVRTLTNASTIKFSYKGDSDVVFNNNTALTTYVTAGTVTFQLKSMPIYKGNTYFIYNGSGVYKGTFPADESANVSDSDALDLGAVVSSDNQSF